MRVRMRECIRDRLIIDRLWFLSMLFLLQSSSPAMYAYGKHCTTINSAQGILNKLHSQQHFSSTITCLNRSEHMSLTSAHILRKFWIFFPFFLYFAHSSVRSFFLRVYISGCAALSSSNFQRILIH